MGLLPRSISLDINVTKEYFINYHNSGKKQALFTKLMGNGAWAVIFLPALTGGVSISRLRQHHSNHPRRTRRFQRRGASVHRRAGGENVIHEKNGLRLQI